jgi:hypothetical protein
LGFDAFDRLGKLDKMVKVVKIVGDLLRKVGEKFSKIAKTIFQRRTMDTSKFFVDLKRFKQLLLARMLLQISSD